MPFIRYENKYSIGEWTTTTKEHSNLYGTMTIGTKVQIVGITDRGYSICDEDGNLITEIGWNI